MFAVIRTGGKQYRVAKDDVISVEKLDGGEGASVTLHPQPRNRRAFAAWRGPVAPVIRITDAGAGEG